MIFYIPKFYNDAEQLGTVISGLDYKDSVFGAEIPDFYHVPNGIENGFSGIVAGIKDKFVLGKKSGVFRKPYPFIHFEDFNMESMFIGIVSLKDATFKLHRHKKDQIEKALDIKEDVEAFIKNECGDEEKWETKAEVKMACGDLVLIQPWYFHSVKSDLVKVFFLNVKTDSVAEKESSS